MIQLCALPALLVATDASISFRQAVAIARDSALEVRVLRHRVEEDSWSRDGEMARLLPRVDLAAKEFGQSSNRIASGNQTPGTDSYVPFHEVEDCGFPPPHSSFRSPNGAAERRRTRDGSTRRRPTRPPCREARSSNAP